MAVFLFLQHVHPHDHVILEPVGMTDGGLGDELDNTMAGQRLT
jgi:hypothetical protein